MFILGIVFKEFVQKGNVIVGLILSILGLACVLLAKSITVNVRHTKAIKSNDTVFMSCSIIGLTVLLLGMVLIALPF